MNYENETQEALTWLKNSKNFSALASDRFGATANAIKFVEQLYEAGAIEVRVVGILDEPERIAEEGGPYATTLLVQLPKTQPKRQALLEIYQQEVTNHGLYEGEEFQGFDEDIIAFWWE